MTQQNDIVVGEAVIMAKPERKGVRYWALHDQQETSSRSVATRIAENMNKMLSAGKGAQK